MTYFLDKFSDKIKGTISGFDRIVIKGIFKNLNYIEGMFTFLFSQKVLLKDLGEYVKNTSIKFKEKYNTNLLFDAIPDIPDTKLKNQFTKPHPTRIFPLTISPLLLILIVYDKNHL
ncbi:MAG: hypothetical protein JXB88_11770 [Spirochaetales bacterium]|nr:hypothetical protein [Spirochaetales bacterium]